MKQTDKQTTNPQGELVKVFECECGFRSAYEGDCPLCPTIKEEWRAQAEQGLL
tara:strand:+ start:167 stop:325 length:159 start_codon:yes stop_codon:yes gene_type:complete